MSHGLFCSCAECWARNNPTVIWGPDETHHHEPGLFDPDPYRHVPSFDELCPKKDDKA